MQFLTAHGLYRLCQEKLQGFDLVVLESKACRGAIEGKEDYSDQAVAFLREWADALEDSEKKPENSS